MRPSWNMLRPYLLAVSIVSLATLLGWLMAAYVSLPNLVLLYVLAVVCVAFVSGQGPSVLASVLGSLAYGTLYAPWTFLDVAESTQYALTALLTMALCLFISQLTVRWRDKAMESAARAQELDRLYRYTRELESERLRNSVLSALSHDLRTPLASLVGASSSLLSQELALTPAARQDLAELIYDESRRMQVLVENLLEMARLESGPVSLQLDWEALEEIIGAVLAVWRPRLQPRAIHVALPADLPLLRFDPRLIERVLSNLLENIGKYTPPQARVDITADVQADHVALTIRDDGPGFAEDPDQLFRKFYRGDSAAATVGAGLGLAICRSIVEAHGGRIVAAPVEPHGASFTLTLPRCAEPPVDEQADIFDESAPSGAQP